MGRREHVLVEMPLVRKTLLQRIRENWEIYLLLLPALVYLIIFSYLPMYGIQIAFKKSSLGIGIWESPWNGVDNFIKFFKGYYFTRTIRNTVTISLYSLLAGIPFPILLALMLNEVRFSKYKRFVQTATYAPYFISTVVMVGMMLLFLNPSYGVFGQILSFFNVPKTDLMHQASSFQHVYVWSGIWQGTGFGSVIYLAVLSSVDMQLHEAAIVEGASKFQRIRAINIPALMPTFVILLILNVGGIMNVSFEKVFLMQHPLNLETSEVISTYVYKIGLTQGSDMGLASAVGLFNSVINCMLLLIVNTISRKVSDTSLW